jgi:hypothetical protein
MGENSPVKSVVQPIYDIPTLPSTGREITGNFSAISREINGYFHTRTNSLLIYKSIVYLMELKETLKTFIEEGKDWERKHTSVKGVSIIRLPATKNRAASLAIDINPIGENGLPLKKRGIMIMNGAEVAAFRTAFNSEKLDSLIAALEDILPERRSTGKPAKADVVQI